MAQVVRIDAEPPQICRRGPSSLGSVDVSDSMCRANLVSLPGASVRAGGADADRDRTAWQRVPRRDRSARRPSVGVRSYV
jgi:hypothetical protein